MAQVRGGIERLRLKYPDLDTSRIRLIGWGAGQAFTDYYPLVGLKVEYTVCPFTHAEGKTIHGVAVKSPQELMREPHEEVVVVIFAALAAEIMNQIRNFFGDYRTVMALTHEADHADLDQLQAYAQVFSGLRFSRPALQAPASLGIFVQGPIFPYTALALSKQRLAYPEAYQCLVTWDHQSRELIDACVPWVDEVVTLPQPEAMVDSRNAIIRSARAGAEALAAAGVRYAVRSRSDAVITGSLYRAMEALFDDGRKNAGKFGFLAHSSWKHVPFHFAERFLIGRMEDMLQLWSLPEDHRNAAELACPLDQHYQKVRILAFECLLWEHFAKSKGYDVATLADGYRFAVKHLVPVDDHADTLSFKNVPLFNLTLNGGFVGTAEWWNDMHVDLDSALRQGQEESALDLTINDFFRGRVR